MNKGIEIARGKTKVLYEVPGQPAQLVVAQTDQISAGDGARRHEIPGKGRLAAQTTARVFRLLNLCGFPTHYLNGGEDDDENEMVVRRAHDDSARSRDARRRGRFVRKTQSGVARGMLLVPRVVEFFFKDDANHDPLIAPEQIVAAKSRGAATKSAAMTEMARLTFDILAHAWRRRDVMLVDLKIEFGRLASGENQGQLAIADVIDNDSWRIWPQGREDLMLDKQMYRNLDTVDDEALANVKHAYEQVAEMVGSFPVMRPGMAAVIADSPGAVDRVNEIVAALGQLGLPAVRHVASPATHARLRAAARRAAGSDVRAADIRRRRRGRRVARDARRCLVVAGADGRRDPAQLAMQCAKLFGIEDTVLFGRALLMQANARSNVIAADTSLQHPTPAQQGGVIG